MKHWHIAVGTMGTYDIILVRSKAYSTLKACEAAIKRLPITKAEHARAIVVGGDCMICLLR